MFFVLLSLFCKSFSYIRVYYEAEPGKGDKQDTGNINLKIEQLQNRAGSGTDILTWSIRCPLFLTSSIWNPHVAKIPERQLSSIVF